MSGEQRPHSLALNVAALFAGRVSVPVLNVGLLIAMARWEGAETVGRYSLLVTAFLLLDQGRLLGLQTLAIRELAQPGAEALRFRRGLLVIGLLTAVAAWGALLAYGYLSLAGLMPAAVLGLAFWPSSAVWANEAYFVGRRQAIHATGVVALEAVVRCVGSFAVLLTLGADLVALALVYLAGRCVGAGVGSVLTRSAPIPGTWTVVRDMVREAPAFAGLSVVPLLLLRMDVLVLGLLASADAVGHYGAAARMVAVLLLLPDSVLAACFANMAHQHGSETHTFWQQAAGNAVVALAVAVPLALCTMAVAPLVVGALFGDAFRPSAPLLAIVVWQVPLFAAARSIGDALIVRGQQRRVALALLACLIPGAPLLFVLTQTGGATGAAIGATVLAAGMLMTSLVAAVLSHGWPTGAEVRLGRRVVPS